MATSGGNFRSGHSGQLADLLRLDSFDIDPQLLASGPGLYAGGQGHPCAPPPGDGQHALPPHLGGAPDGGVNGPARFDSLDMMVNSGSFDFGLLKIAASDAVLQQQQTGGPAAAHPLAGAHLPFSAPEPPGGGTLSPGSPVFGAPSFLHPSGPFQQPLGGRAPPFDVMPSGGNGGIVTLENLEQLLHRYSANLPDSNPCGREDGQGAKRQKSPPPHVRASSVPPAGRLPYLAAQYGLEYGGRQGDLPLPPPLSTPASPTHGAGLATRDDLFRLAQLQLPSHYAALGGGMHTLPDTCSPGLSPRFSGETLPGQSATSSPVHGGGGAQVPSPPGRGRSPRPARRKAPGRRSPAVSRSPSPLASPRKRTWGGLLDGDADDPRAAAAAQESLESVHDDVALAKGGPPGEGPPAPAAAAPRKRSTRATNSGGGGGGRRGTPPGTPANEQQSCGNSAVTPPDSGDGDVEDGEGDGKGGRQRKSVSDNPHAVAVRMRRGRISQHIRTLFELVPGVEGLDTASMLEKAITYVHSLQAQLQALTLRRTARARGEQPAADWSAAAPKPATDQQWPI